MPATARGARHYVLRRNNDHGFRLAADPKNGRRTRRRSSLPLHTPVEDPAVYENVFKPFTNPSRANAWTISRVLSCNRTRRRSRRCGSGRLHVAGFSTANRLSPSICRRRVPFAVKGTRRNFRLQPDRHRQGELAVSETLRSQGAEKSRAHSPSSNSGHMAPLALFPGEGLTARQDYNIIFSGKHDQSVRAQFRRLRRRRGRVGRLHTACASAARSRNLTSGSLPQPEIPVLVVRLPHDLDPKLVDKMLGCFYDYRFRRRCRKHSTRAIDSFRSTTRRLGLVRDWPRARVAASTSLVRKGNARRRLRRPKKRSDAKAGSSLAADPKPLDSRLPRE